MLAVAWYGVQRFTLDFLRVGDASVGPISWNQLSGLTAGLAGVALFLTLGRFRSADEDAIGPEQPTSVKT
jgi:prolipoprotein diacylglyceryltransferase